MSHAAAVLLFEGCTPPRHHLECDRVRGDIAPHISNPKPSRPPDFLAGEEGTSGPFRRSEVDLKRSTDGARRIASCGFRQVARELLEIDKRRRVALTYRLPSLIPLGRKRPRFGTVRTASDNLETERPHCARRAPITATCNRRVVGNFDPTHRTAASVRRTPPQRAPRPAPQSIRGIGAGGVAGATFPQLRRSRSPWSGRVPENLDRARPRRTPQSQPPTNRGVPQQPPRIYRHERECDAGGP